MLATDPGQFDIGQVRLVLFVGCILLALGGAYTLRRRGWLKPAWSKPVMSASIVVCDAPVALLSIWHLRMLEGVWKVPAAGGLVAVAACLVGLGIARSRRMAPADGAVFGLQSGMGNVGYTLGGGLCFAIWGLQGLALEQMYCLMWPFVAFLFCFPLARHYGDRVRGRRAGAGPDLAYAGRTLLRSVTDIRSLPLYTAAIGLVLNLRGVGPPGDIERWHVVDVLMVLGILTQFGGVGMTVYVRRLPAFWKTSAASAALKFLVSPALMVAAAWAIGLTGVPFAVCVLLAAMPSALYSVLMANLFGLNKDLANATFLLTHAVCLAVVAVVAVVYVLS